MNEEAGFLHAIEQNPHEITNHLAYKDWLLDRGRDEDAEFRQNMADWIQSGPFMDPAERSDPASPRFNPRHAAYPYAVAGHLADGEGAAVLPTGVNLARTDYLRGEGNYVHGMVGGRHLYQQVADPDAHLASQPEHVALWSLHQENPETGYPDPAFGHLSWRTYRGLESAMRRAWRPPSSRPARMMRARRKALG